MKKCRERGKWDLLSRLAYKYGIVCIGDKFYDQNNTGHYRLDKKKI